MRYFRYKNTNKSFNNALKEQYKTLTANEKRTFRLEKRWSRLSTVVTLVVFCSFAVLGIFLLKSIPLPNDKNLETLVIVGEAFAYIIMLIAGGFLTYALTIPLWKKVKSFNIPAMKKEIFSKACEPLRDYYRLQEPYIITKCFDATDEKFRNHDVCIFVVEDELRITTDLVHGFLHGQRDLGCYSFRQNEITISKNQNGNYLAAELKADGAVFLLGYRAIGFINKNFTGRLTQ